MSITNQLPVVIRYQSGSEFAFGCTCLNNFHPDTTSIAVVLTNLSSAYPPIRCVNRFYDWYGSGKCIYVLRAFYIVAMYDFEHERFQPSRQSSCRVLHIFQILQCQVIRYNGEFHAVDVRPFSVPPHESQPTIPSQWW